MKNSSTAFFSLVALIFFSAISFAAENPRTDFRAAIEKYAATFSDADHPATCDTWNYGEGIKTQDLNFTIADDSSEYADAFFVYFNTGTDLWFSTLVAYEGYQGHLLGELRTESDQNGVTYIHTFYGAYTDVFKVLKANDGSIKLRYDKFYNGTHTKAVVCKPTPGQTK
jgi:hypothetical protein